MNYELKESGRGLIKLLYQYLPTEYVNQDGRCPSRVSKQPPPVTSLQSYS
jgi:hypothetical protein